MLEPWFGRLYLFAPRWPEWYRLLSDFFYTTCGRLGRAQRSTFVNRPVTVEQDSDSFPVTQARQSGYRSEWKQPTIAIETGRVMKRPGAWYGCCALQNCFNFIYSHWQVSIRLSWSAHEPCSGASDNAQTELLVLQDYFVLAVLLISSGMFAFGNVSSHSSLN